MFLEAMKERRGTLDGVGLLVVDIGSLSGYQLGNGNGNAKKHNVSNVGLV